MRQNRSIERLVRKHVGGAQTRRCANTSVVPSAPRGCHISFSAAIPAAIPAQYFFEGIFSKEFFEGIFLRKNENMQTSKFEGIFFEKKRYGVYEQHCESSNMPHSEKLANVI